jgi:AhpC/TSA antioxidant enzyme
MILATYRFRPYATREKLAREGVETLAIVNSPEERARQYFQYRPTRVLLAADPDVRTHRALRLPRIGFVADGTDPAELYWPERTTMAQFLAVRLNPTGELPGPQNMPEASETLNKRDGFELTEGDRQTFEAHGAQLPGQFLIDARGTIRWSHVEGADRPEDIAKFPSDGEILAAVEAMSR